MTIIRIGEPDEIREFTLGRLELYRLGGLEIGRAVYAPGWRWTEHVRPIAGTALCEVEHVGLVLAGAAAVRFADGRQVVLKTGDFFALSPGHDSWVIGEEEYISLHLLGADVYATSSRL